MSLTDELRSFNRFYTREIGLLNRRLPGGDLSLPEARVLYEIAQARRRPAGRPPTSDERCAWTRRISAGSWRGFAPAA